MFLTDFVIPYNFISPSETAEATEEAQRAVEGLNLRGSLWLLCVLCGPGPQNLLESVMFIVKSFKPSEHAEIINTGHGNVWKYMVFGLLSRVGRDLQSRPQYFGVPERSGRDYKSRPALNHQYRTWKCLEIYGFRIVVGIACN